MGAWIFFNILFLTGTAQALYNTAFYFKILDKSTGAKNSIVDIIVGAFSVLGSTILILGLSDKIYAFSWTSLSIESVLQKKNFFGLNRFFV